MDKKLLLSMLFQFKPPIETEQSQEKECCGELRFNVSERADVCQSCGKMFDHDVLCDCRQCWPGSRTMASAINPARRQYIRKTIAQMGLSLTCDQEECLTFNMLKVKEMADGSINHPRIMWHVMKEVCPGDPNIKLIEKFNPKGRKPLQRADDLWKKYYEEKKCYFEKN